MTRFALTSPLFALALALLTPLPAFAAPLPLDSLVGEALANHPALASARAAEVGATARAGAARSPWLPQVNANSGVSTTTNVSNSQLATKPFVLTSAGLSVRQQLWDFGKTAADVRAAEATERATRVEITTAAVEVAYAVRRAYFDWAQARATTAQAQARLKNADDLLAQATAFWKAGRRAKIESVRAEADREAAKADVVTARTTADQALRALAAAMAVEAPPVGEPVFPTLPPIVTAKLPALLSRAYETHPTLVSVGFRAEATAARADSVARAGWPDLGADANYGIRARDVDLGQNWSAGVSLSAPLFTGFAQTRQIEAARADLDAARANVANQVRTIKLGIEQAYLGLQGARERQPASASLARSARENWRLASGRYRAGVGSSVEVSDARALLASAEAGEVRAMADVHRAVADLWRALGETGR